MATENSPRSGTRLGFTLVELLVVIAIIGVLIAIALPAFSRVRTQARISSTQTLMSSINAGIAQYQTDRRRLPGVFSAEEIGSSDNFNGGWLTRPGITAMENALLDLAGGAFATEQELENAGFTTGQAIEITLNDKTVYVVTALVGSAGDNGYVDLGGDVLVALERQNSRLPQNGLPDVLDSFGNPIMLWSINENAGRTAGYVAEDSDGGTKALFYWASNGSYAMSGFPRSTTSGNRPPVGTNQYQRSLLSSELIGSVNDRLRSIMAVTGNRSFPTTSSELANPGIGPSDPNILVPAQPRGETILMSAGPDRIYLNAFPSGSRTRDFDSAAYTPTGDFERNQIDPNAQVIERFDEIVLGGG